jgi:hypothetical protein
MFESYTSFASIKNAQRCLRRAIDLSYPCLTFGTPASDRPAICIRVIIIVAIHIDNGTGFLILVGGKESYHHHNSPGTDQVAKL